jgi:hypothetical protein
MDFVTPSTLLEIGKYYNVPCAMLKIYDGSVLFVPTIGEKHKDPQFSVDDDHYHIDGRFAKVGSGANYTVDHEGRTNGIVCAGEFNGAELIKVVTRRLKCRRLTTGLRPPEKYSVEAKGSKNAAKYWAWRANMVGKSCKGRKCPHLGTTMLEQDGVLVCPLHNLVGSVETETIIDYPI